jgi:hypothetical protein
MIKLHENYDLLDSEYQKAIDLIGRCSEPFVVNGIIVGYPFNLIDSISMFGKEFIPDVQGIYHLFYKDMLVYVGMSRNLRGRLLQHLKDESMVFQNVLWFCLKDKKIEEILELEYKMIKKFKPSLNLTYANCR